MSNGRPCFIKSASIQQKMTGCFYQELRADNNLDFFIELVILEVQFFSTLKVLKLAGYEFLK